MNCNDVKPGIKVKTTKLESTKGMTIHNRYLSCRKSGITGRVLEYVPGHGGDVWFVQHDDSGEIGAYCFTELEDI